MNHNSIQDIILFLLHNQFYISQDLAAHIDQYKYLIENEPRQFHVDVIEQFIIIAKQRISDMISENVAADAESIQTVLDGMDIREYLMGATNV